MKKTHIYILLMAILPWLTIPLLGKKTMKRFLPGSLFMSFYVLLEGMLAEKKKWWWFSLKVKPNVLAEIPLIIGPFLVGSLWILKYTYGKLKLFLVVNLVVDSFFTYFGIHLIKKMGYGSLVRLSKFRLSLLFLVKSFVLYGFQFIYEKLMALGGTSSKYKKWT